MKTPVLELIETIRTIAVSAVRKNKKESNPKNVVTERLLYSE